MPIAEFDDPADADEAWTILEESDIPASVVTDAALLGSDEVTRVYVAAINVAKAQSLIAHLVRRPGSR